MSENNQNLNVNNTEKLKEIIKKLLPSFIVFIISFSFSIKILIEIFSGSNIELSTIFITHLKSFDSYPIIFYVFFIAILLWCRMKVKKCSENGGSSKEIEKIIDQWSGLVDGIGTALPLLGAAGILFTVGMGREYQSLFIEFAVPFEIKSLFILAIAKLLDFAFDELDRQYVGNDIENAKQVDFSGVTSTILPDLQTLERLNTVIASWKAAVNEMQKKDFKDTIDSLNKLTGREQSNK